MSDVITITVTTEAEQAAEKLQKMAESAATVTSSLGDLSTKALALGGVQFPQLSAVTGSIAQGLTTLSAASQLTGVAMGTLAVPLAGILAALAIGAASWKDYQAQVEATKNLTDTFGSQDKIADRLKEQVKLLLQANKLTKAQAEAMNVKLAAPNFENIKSVQKELRPIVGTREQDDAAKKAAEDAKKLAEEQRAATQKLADLQRDMQIDMLDGTDKLKAEAKEAFDEKQAQIKALGGTQEQINAALATAQADYDYHLKQIDADAKADAANKAAAAAEKQHDAEQKKVEDYNEQQEKLERIAELKEQIARSETEAKLKAVHDNPFLTDQQKTQQSIPLWQEQLQNNAAQENGLNATIAKPGTDEEARLEAQQKLNDLKEKDAELTRQINAAEGQSSFAYQFQSLATSMQNVQPVAKQLADTLQSTWDSAESSSSSALSSMIEGTKNWRQASVQIYNSVVDSFVKGISQMVVQHLFGETAKTAATQTGTTARTMWSNVETMAHNLGVMLRTLFHIQGETTATTTTATQTGTRIGQHAAAAGSGAAESQASIPYVGPILAVAAMAAIVAAVLALRGGFEAGGFTGAGASGQPAGIVHAGEFVFNQEAVNRIGLPMLNDLHNGVVSPETAQNLMANGGGGASAAASSQAAKPEMHFHALFDKEDIRRIAQSQGGEHWVLDVVSQNIHKFR